VSFTNWEEIRTAYQVARLGTVSGAAEALGVHHATVIRHVDALEDRLGQRLFQRHARGYTPTEAGQWLLETAAAADDRFTQLAARLGGSTNSMAGELIVTTVPGASPLILPTLLRLQEAHPELLLRYITDSRLLRLEYGEAHVALRAGAKPQDPDNVVQPLLVYEHALYASAGYIARHGMPESDEELFRRRFVGSAYAETTQVPFMRWLAANVPRDQIVFRTNDLLVHSEAIASGVGIGFVAVPIGRQRGDLVQVRAPRKEWCATLWLVTHVDLHRTPRVQAFVKALKQDVASRDRASAG
jgi:DNA-binding transcriptional LysR family regulator